jgi:quercetin dioxygenase-like cupin family protein
MDLKSTLKVFRETDVPSGPGVVPGHTTRRLAGNAERPSERIMAMSASFKTGTVEHLHWHLIEAFYYVISGSAVVRDIEGKTYNVEPGSVIYAPPGIAGSHGWEAKEELRLLVIRPTTDPARIFQITVDESTRESRIKFSQLVDESVPGGAVKLKKSLY